MKRRFRNALVIVVIALGVFVAFEQMGVTGTDFTDRIFQALVFDS